MNKKKILALREPGSFGYSNTAAIIEAIYELDKSIKSLKTDLKEVYKQQKYMWQTLEEHDALHENDGVKDGS